MNYREDLYEQYGDHYKGRNIAAEADEMGDDDEL